jgi:potassium/hydrogen antiporter
MAFELPLDPLVLVAGWLLVAGVLAAALAFRTRVPALLVFLVVGMAIGDDGLGVISLDDPVVAQTAGVLALLVILFEGGLTTRAADLRRAAVPGFLLATLGVVLTAAVVAGGVLLLTDLDLTTALLLGAVVSSTDAAAVFTVVRRSPLPRRVTSLLEVESGANDPMAVLLTIGILEAWRAELAWHELALFGVVQLGGGLVVGAVVGAGAVLLMGRLELGAAALYPVLALAFAATAYGAAATTGGSGFLAVYVCGLLVGLYVPRHRRGIRTFHQGLAGVAEIGLFLLLGLLVFPSQLPPVALPALAVTAVLIVLARPVAVYATLAFEFITRRWGARELAVTSWAGLRGAVPIVLATFPLTAAHPDGAVIFNIVFFVVLVSTAVQGTTIPAAARLLGLGKDTAVWTPVAEVLPTDDDALDVIEIEITDDLAVSGRLLRDVPLPADARLAVILRDNRTIVPTGVTRLHPGDRAIATAPRRPGNTRLLTGWATGRPGGR